MDKTQVVSLMLLLALVFALVLCGTRAFSDAPAEVDEVTAPPKAAPERDRLPELQPNRVPSYQDPAWLYERRFA